MSKSNKGTATAPSAASLSDIRRGRCSTDKPPSNSNSNSTNQQYQQQEAARHRQEDLHASSITSVSAGLPGKEPYQPPHSSPSKKHPQQQAITTTSTTSSTKKNKIVVSPNKKGKKNKMSKIMGGHNNPIANFFRGGSSPRKSRQQQQQQEWEDSPLLSLPVVEEGSSSYQSQNGVLIPSNRPKIGQAPYHPVPPKQKDYWKILKTKIDHGDLLLSGMGGDQVQDRTPPADPLAGQLEHHERRLQKAIDEIRQGSEFTLGQCVLAIVIYLGISIVCFNYFLEPEWTIIDSCYFAMVTFTTIGYGDEVPTTRASRIFTCFYALSGVAILGIALGVVGSNLVDAQEKMASQAGALLKDQVMSVFESGGQSEVSKVSESFIEGDNQNGNLEVGGGNATTNSSTTKTKELRGPSLVSTLTDCLKNFVPLLAVLLGMAYWIGHLAGWTLLESVYFLIVTASTVGYGDYTPTTTEQKTIAIFFIPIAVGTVGVWLSGIASVIVEARSARYRQSMGMKELTQHDLDIMDRDRDGTVSRAEFLEFMLVAMNKVDQSLIQELRDYFDRLDEDGTGELTKEDLIAIARKKVHNPVHKLRLSAYKQSLLDRGKRRNRRFTLENTALSVWGSRFFNNLGFNGEEEQHEQQENQATSNQGGAHWRSRRSSDRYHTTIMDV